MTAEAAEHGPILLNEILSGLFRDNQPKPQATQPGRTCGAGTSASADWNQSPLHPRPHKETETGHDVTRTPNPFRSEGAVCCQEGPVRTPFATNGQVPRSSHQNLPASTFTHVFPQTPKTPSAKPSRQDGCEHSRFPISLLVPSRLITRPLPQALPFWVLAFGSNGARTWVWQHPEGLPTTREGPHTQAGIFTKGGAHSPVVLNLHPNPPEKVSKGNNIASIFHVEKKEFKNLPLYTQTI